MKTILYSSALFLVAGLAQASEIFLQNGQPQTLTVDQDNMSCLLYDDYTMFNLKPLQSKDGY